MGRRTENITVTVQLSDHNSEQDEIDEALARDLAQRIKAIAEEPQYADILVFPPDPDSI
jgi:hypothetical protein